MKPCLQELQHIKVFSQLDLLCLIYFINRYNIVITELHNAEEKILDLKEKIKERKNQNEEVTGIVKNLQQ